MDAPVNAKVALLQALVSGPGFGLDLIERVEKKTKGRMKLHQGSVYPALRALEADGLVTSYDGDELVPERGGRPRRYYKLSAKGAKALNEHKATIVGLFGPVVEGA